MSTIKASQITDAIRNQLDSQRRLIDAITGQLTDEELRQRLSPQQNSVANLLRHLGGNLVSRWTEFLTTDGEKSTRNREAEFEDWDGDRESLTEFFDAGWQCLMASIDLIDDENIHRSVLIRGEEQGVLDALLRSVMHISYHVGQMAIIARAVHQGEWNWLTIPPGESERHNATTWGTSASRGIAGQESDQA